MNRMKKIGITAALACMLSASAYASGITVADEYGAVKNDGTSEYSAVITNDSQDTVKPYIMIVRYEDDILVSAACSSTELNVGESKTVSQTLSGGIVDDNTKISGFIWDSKNYSIPIAIKEIEKKGSKDLTIKNLQLGGKEAEVDNINRSITAYVPLYDAGGMMLNDAVPAAAVLGSRGGKISFSGYELSGEAESKEGSISLSAKPVVTLTSEEGETAEYSLKLYRTFEDDFDDGTLFTGATAGVLSAGGDLSWKAAEAESGLIGADGENMFSGIGDFSASIKTTKNQMWKYGTDQEKADEVAGGIDVGLAPVSDGTFNNNSNSYESGNALRLSKRVALRNNGANGDTPAPFFDINIGGGSDLLTYEFDMGIDYSHCKTESGSTKNYCVGSLSAGIRIMSGNDSAGTDLVGTQATASSDTRASDYLCDKKTGATLDKWHHIKLVFTAGTGEIYIDDMETPYRIAEVSKQPTGLRMFTSTMRACEIYIDNLKIVYDVK